MPKELLRDSTPPAHTGVCARKGVKLPCYPEGEPLATHALIWLTFVASVIPLGTEMPTMDQTIMITIGCTFAITLGLLLGLGYYLGRQKRLIDEIGFMVALLLDHLQVLELHLRIVRLKPWLTSSNLLMSGGTTRF